MTVCFWCDGKEAVVWEVSAVSDEGLTVSPRATVSRVAVGRWCKLVEGAWLWLSELGKGEGKPVWGKNGVSCLRYVLSRLPFVSGASTAWVVVHLRPASSYAHVPDHRASTVLLP